MEFVVENLEKNRFSYMLNGKAVRFYKHEGVYMPSVTAILDQTKDKESLIKWRKRIGEEKADEILRFSGVRGTFLHDWIEVLLKNKARKASDIFKYMDEDEIIDLNHLEEMEVAATMLKTAYRRPMQDQFTKKETLMLPELIDEVLYCEHMVHYIWPDEGAYAGSFDMVAKDNQGGNILIDFKTATKPKTQMKYIKDYTHQICAYWNAIESCMNIRLDRAAIVMFNDINDLIQYWEFDREFVEDHLPVFRDRVKKFNKILNIDPSIYNLNTLSTR